MADEASIFHVAPQQPPNLLGMMGQFASTQNALNQAQMFQQEFEARKAMGPIAQGAIDPKTGTMNWPKFLVDISRNPATAWKAQEIINSVVQRELVSAQTAEINLRNAKTEYGAFGSGIAAIMSKAEAGQSYKDKLGNPVPMAVSDGDVLQLGAGLRAQGITSEKVWKLITGMPRDADGKIDPIKAYPVLKQFMLQSQDAEKTIGGVYDNVFTDRGGVKEYSNRNKYENKITPATGGQLSDQPTAAARNALDVKKVNPVTGAEETDARGSLPLQSGSGAPAMGSLATGGEAPQAAGAVPAAPGAAAAPQSAASPPTASFTSKLGPVQQKSLEEMADYAKGVNTKGADAVRSNNIIDALLDAQSKTRVGGGTDIRVKLAELAQHFPGVPTETVDAIAGGKLSEAQKIQKLSISLGAAALRQALETGRITQREFDTFQNANPNYKTDPRAFREMLGFIRNQNQVDAGRQQAYQIVYGNAMRGEKLPEGMHDLTGFDSWYNGMVQRTRDKAKAGK